MPARILKFVPYVLVAVGLVLLGRPMIEDLYESWKAQQGIQAVESAYEQMDEAKRAELIQEAEVYDEELLHGSLSDDRLPYNKQLSYEDVDMISHLVVPKLSLDLPIFHGIDDNVLMIGVGHVEGTSLPVGTVGGRCVLAGHSGMPNARMFDDIHLLEKGDRFVLWTLGEAYAYEVIDSEVVEPSAVEKLNPVEGEDLVTLVTCTPYRVNTHRLLVTGRRCEYVPDEEIIPDTEVYVNRRTLPLIIGCVVVIVVSTGSSVILHRKYKKGDSK